MPAQIRLTREAPFLPFVGNRRQSERLRITAEGLGGAPSEIFLQQQPLGGSEEFVGVATKIDLDTYPVDAADPDLPPYYRTAVIDVILRDPREAQEIWEEITAAVARLVLSLNQVAADETSDVASFS